MCSRTPLRHKIHMIYEVIFYEKRIRFRWIALGIFLAALVIFVGKCISLYPVYPDFKKEVHSYDQIQQALQNHPKSACRIYPISPLQMNTFH